MVQQEGAEFSTNATYTTPGMDISIAPNHAQHTRARWGARAAAPCVYKVAELVNFQAYN